MKANVKYTALAIMIVAVAVAAGGVALREYTQSRSSSSVPPVSLAKPAQQSAPVGVGKPPADCHLPGPAPAVPDGHTADVDSMRQGHDNIQGFVLQLEAYQACRNNQIDHAAANTPVSQKQSWLDEGNDAVDQANALAHAFAAQLRVFKARKLGK